MNVMLVVDAFLPHSGGARVYYYNLYKRLAHDFGHQVTIVTKKVPGWQEFDEVESRGNLRVIRRGAPLKTWKYHELPKIAVTMTEALRVLATQSVDVIHAGDMFPPGVAAVWLKRLTAKPFLMFLHGDELAQIELRRHQPRIRDIILRNASAVVAANEFARKKAIETGLDADKVHVVTPGVDLERFRPEPPPADLARRYGVGGKVVLLTAARLAPKKGHATVIRALARILPRNPDVRYLIAGDGPERERLEALTRTLGLQHAITFMGDVPNHVLGDVYNLSDIFVMANRRVSGGDLETFGMVFIEANATGKPVIGGRSGGALEAIEHGRTGFLVDPDDEEDFARTMELLITNEDLRKRMGSEGLRRVRSQFTWESRAAYLNNLSSEINAVKRRIVA